MTDILIVEQLELQHIPDHGVLLVLIRHLNVDLDVFIPRLWLHKFV